MIYLPLTTVLNWLVGWVHFPPACATYNNVRILHCQWHCGYSHFQKGETCSEATFLFRTLLFSMTYPQHFLSFWPDCDQNIIKVFAQSRFQVQIPKDVQFLTASLAFLAESFLFTNHSHGKNEVHQVKKGNGDPSIVTLAEGCQRIW